MKKLTSLTRLTLIAGLFLATASSAFATVTLTGASGGGHALAQATVTTDQSDSPPGSSVQIAGSGFQPGEALKDTIHS